MKIIIRTYEELEQRVNAFSQMTLPLLVLHGPPGTSKSTAVRKMFPHGTHARWVNGTASAFGLFGELRRYRDMPFVLDDLDDAFRDKALIRLMKQVCQTDAVRRISWVTNAIKGTPGDGDDSRSFETSSRVVLIVNDWQKMNRHVGAVGDRAWELEFLPTPQEIHRFVGSWRHEALNADGMPTVAGPVYEYIGDRLDAVSDTHPPVHPCDSGAPRGSGLEEGPGIRVGQHGPQDASQTVGRRRRVCAGRASNRPVPRLDWTQPVTIFRNQRLTWAEVQSTAGRLPPRSR